MSNTHLTQETVERLSTDISFQSTSTTPIAQETVDKMLMNSHVQPTPMNYSPITRSPVELWESFVNEDITPQPLTTYETIIGAAASIAIIGISVGIAYNTKC